METGAARMTDVIEDVEAARSGPSESDELLALALEAQAGKPGAFDALAERISRRILAFAQQSLPNPGLAEEVMQESLYRIYRYLPSYSGGSFLAWCLTISNRLCADVARRESKHAKHRTLERTNVADHSDASDLRAVIDQALREIAPSLRTTFVLRQQGLGYADIARVLEVPVGTVRSRLFEARRLLREKLRVALEDGES